PVTRIGLVTAADCSASVALLDIASLLNQATVRQWRIICVTRSRGAVEIFRQWLIEWCITAYAFGKVRICDVVSTEGAKVAGSFGDKAGTRLGVDPDVQDERSSVNATEVMHDGVSAHVLDWSAGKVCILPHQKHVR